jgi:hypothetical protein
MELAATTHKRSNVRVVTIKHPPPVLEAMPSDNLAVGKVFDLSPQLAILMIAAGWVRTETRSRVRRQRESLPAFNRREMGDRRSAHAA